MTEQSDKSHRRPTMQDVAARAGVSQMTVSRVMRKNAPVSDDVAARVHGAAAALGYVHNRIAGGLAGRSSGLVGVILPTLGNRVFTEVLSGVADGLAASGARPLFGVTEYSPGDEAALIADLMSWRPMGLIVTGLEHAPAARALLMNADIPVAEIMDTDGNPVSAAFGFSQAAAGAGMARHLLEKGHRSFGYIGARLGADLRAAKRLAAFVDTIRAAGGRLVTEAIGEAPSSMTEGRSLAARLWHDARPDAIYCANDDLAAGALMHFLGLGVRVPQDVALAGFNGLDFLDALPQRITTTRTPRHEIGRRAALHVASGGAAGVVDLGFDLIAGETS